MSGLDMSEAIRMLANEKNISVDALLHVMVDALATAYKRRPGAAVCETGAVAPIRPPSMQYTLRVRSGSGSPPGPGPVADVVWRRGRKPTSFS